MPVACTAIFSATSTATEPESVKNTRVSGSGVIETSSSPSSTAGSCVSPPNITCAKRSTCACRAASSTGWRYPWIAAHQDDMRPTTGPTTYPKDVVGTELEDSFRIDRAWREGRIVRDGEPEWHADTPVRREAVPVRRGDSVIAVLSRDTNLSATRVPSQLELAYLTAAGELLQMVAEGAFPFPTSDPDPEHAPRVGDGLLRLDRTGHVVYASPNASSAYRRLGVTGDLLGAHLGAITARIGAGPGRLSEPKGSAAIAAALRFQEPRDSELEARGAVVALRVLPLFPGGEPRGALVLVRDVTELRRRDRQIMGKDATIREIHHRVKNNLQTVAALLRMQSRRMTDPAARSARVVSAARSDPAHGLLEGGPGRVVGDSPGL